MKNLQEATERICELKGSLLALDALVTALLQDMPHAQRTALLQTFERNVEIARSALLHAPISDLSIAVFDNDVQRTSTLIGAGLR